jgi:methionyl-tRNA formyltransferase
MPQDMDRLNIIFAGAGEFGLPTLERLTQTHNLVQVITQPDRPAGRGKKLTPTAIAQFAQSHQLPILQTSNINNESLPPADIMVVIAFGQKIAPHIVNHPRLGSVNLHASLLPKYRGAAPINAAILHGDAVSGNSVIRLAERMDAGAILAQSQVAVGERTAGELHDLLAQDGPSLIERVLSALASGTAVEQPQDDSLATIAPKLNRQSTFLDWQRPAHEISNQIRGLYPWPGCRVRLLDGQKEMDRLTLVRGQTRPSNDQPPGFIALDGTLSTGGGSIQILQLQPEGKRLMPFADYRNGHPWMVQMRVESIT